jgi:hypothetical protein
MVQLSIYLENWSGFAEIYIVAAKWAFNNLHALPNLIAKSRKIHKIYSLAICAGKSRHFRANFGSWFRWAKLVIWQPLPPHTFYLFELNFNFLLP